MIFKKFSSFCIFTFSVFFEKQRIFLLNAASENAIMRGFSFLMRGTEVD